MLTDIYNRTPVSDEENMFCGRIFVVKNGGSFQPCDLTAKHPYGSVGTEIKTVY